MDMLQIGEAILDPGLQWINFFNGRLLSGEDLTQERYASAISRQRLGQAIGDGIVWGLQVIANKLNSPVREDFVVTVKPGLAINRSGRPLALESEASVWLLPVDTSQTTTVKSGYFAPCLGAKSGGFIQGGVYLLTLFPAEGPSQELAPVSGLGNSSAGCISRYRKEGVQFRLLPIDPKQMVAWMSDWNNLPADRIRNRLAYTIFSFPELATLQPPKVFAPSPTDSTQVDLPVGELLDALRPVPPDNVITDPATTLTPCDVPLALVYITDNGGLQFVDMGSVRRRVSTSRGLFGGSPWDSLLGDRVRTVGEAMLLQFEEHLDFISNKVGGLSAVQAKTYFRYLPPVGILPLASVKQPNGAVAQTFFTGLKLRSVFQDPLFIESAVLPALLNEAVLYPPIDLEGGETFWVYFVHENQQAYTTGGAKAPQPYLVFVNGHIPYRGDARYDLSYWKYSNYV